MFKDPFRDRLFNWSRYYRSSRHTCENMIHRMMVLYGEKEEGDVLPQRDDSLPRINAEDAEYIEKMLSLWRTSGGYEIQKMARLIILCWLTNYRPMRIKKKTGIFCSDQHMKLLQAERCFKNYIEEKNSTLWS